MLKATESVTISYYYLDPLRHNSASKCYFIKTWKDRPIHTCLLAYRQTDGYFSDSLSPHGCWTSAKKGTFQSLNSASLSKHSASSLPAASKAHPTFQFTIYHYLEKYK